MAAPPMVDGACQETVTFWLPAVPETLVGLLGAAALTTWASAGLVLGWRSAPPE